MKVDQIKFKEASKAHKLERMALDVVVEGASFKFFMDKLKQHDQSWAKNIK